MTAAENGAAQPTVRPATGWLSVEHGEVHLGGAPSASETTRLALQAAVLTTHAQPSVELLDWFMAHRHQRLTWDKDDTPALVRLLRSHEPRGWNLLERTGVLARALPEIGAAIRRRRADITNVDPVGALRFRVAERLDDLAIEAATNGSDSRPFPVFCRTRPTNWPAWRASAIRFPSQDACASPLHQQPRPTSGRSTSPAATAMHFSPT